ncbi:MAG: pyridoxamine 5'-phosphate oxidase family protein [Propionibacteriaceae bacterium]|nr:pyridoxamine 5'-phosphate oxidase family protein [Propionibacteriaceae bacterium]
MTAPGYLLPIAPDECRQLLAERVVGRVAWQSSKGLMLLPLNYSFDGEAIWFRVKRDSVLAELADGRDIVFEIEDVDEETSGGWSVLVRGRVGVPTARPADEPQPWAPGDRDLLLVMGIDDITGRTVSA